MNATQLPPADELHAVREQQKILEAREAELRTLLLSDPSSRTGNSYVAELAEVETTRTDLRELRKMYPAIAEEFTFPAKVVRVVLSAITEDGEIVPARRAPKLKTLRIV